jgi:4'-phosphopantetheinyl transferase EntD
VLERLIPAVASSVETRGDAAGEALYDIERRVLGRAVQKRRHEFVTGRACARQALARLGAPVGAIPAGSRGEPLWPDGVVGSITHCAGYRAAAVAWSAEVAALGIDAEPDDPLPEGVLEQVAFGRELDVVAAGGPVDVGRLLFSAKEAVYKAWFPLAGRALGFEDVELSIDVAGGTFVAELLVPGPAVGGETLTALRGRWAVQDAIIATAVAVPRLGTPPSVASGAR